jgi:hypothetical protein
MRTSPKRTQLYSLRDFTGGLNLVADAFKLQENESPDLLNVDIDRRGGFQVRRGVYPYSATALSASPNTIWSYNDAGTVYTMVQVGTGVRYSTGSTWTNLTRLVSGVATDDLGTADGSGVNGRLAYNISNGLTAGVNLSYDQAFETRFSADLKYRFGGNGNKNQSEKKAWQTPVIQSLTESVRNRDIRVHDSTFFSYYGAKVYYTPVCNKLIC